MAPLVPVIRTTQRDYGHLERGYLRDAAERAEPLSRSVTKRDHGRRSRLGGQPTPERRTPALRGVSFIRPRGPRPPRHTAQGPQPGRPFSADHGHESGIPATMGSARRPGRCSAGRSGVSDGRFGADAGLTRPARPDPAPRWKRPPRTVGARKDTGPASEVRVTLFARSVIRGVMRPESYSRREGEAGPGQ